MKLAALLLVLSASWAGAFPVTIKSCNRTVTFDAPPQRAVSHDVNLTEMMLVLGLRDHMVGYTGISGWKTLDENTRRDVRELPELATHYPSKEVLVGAQADFFFAGWNYDMKVGGEVTPETLAPFGIKTYELTESCIHVGAKDKITLDDMYQDLRNLGRIFGVEARAEALIKGYKARIAELTAQKHKRLIQVFVYDSGEEAPFTAGKYAMPTALIETAGGKNVMDDLDKSWAKISWEAVIERNPEFVVIVDYGDVTADQKIAFMKNNPALAQIRAVQNNNFIVLAYNEATPGPRNIAAIEKLVAGFAAGKF